MKKQIGLLLFLAAFITKTDAQDLYKSAYTFIGKTKSYIIEAKGKNYESTDEGDIMYEIKNAKGTQPGVIRYSFSENLCNGIAMFYDSKQLNAVKDYMNKTFTPDEAKIPGTELWVKMWIEKEQNGRYTWSLTEKESFFFLTIMFYKK